MTSHPESKILDIAEWTDHAVQLKDFVGKYPVPNIVKVTKGQYRNIGFAKSVHSHLYLYSVSTGRKILAESVKVKEGKKATVSDQKYAIPLSYQGWFEVLSEDGKAVKAIENVRELFTTFHFSKNPKYLVRDNTKAFVQTDSGELGVEKSKLIHRGEVIMVTGEIYLPQQTSKGIIKRKLVSCEDSSGDGFYLDFEQKGLFSPVAGQQNISGVHNVNAILQKFRLPITVRLVSGIIPNKLEKHCTGVFRLLHIYSDETAILCPLKKDSKMVPVSTREPIKIVPAGNFDDIKGLEEFQYVNERCANMYNSFMNSIHVLFSLPEPEAITPMKQRVNAKNEDTKTNIDPEEENILFEEVEDIYQYVRDGGPVPPAPRPRPIRSKPPPLPEKKGNAKAKLSYLGRSLVNKLSTTKEPQPANHHQGYPYVEEILPEPVIPARDFPEAEPKKSEKPEWDWEEPIYEPLDKIRNQKKNKGKKQERQMDILPPELLTDPFENFHATPPVTAGTGGLDKPTPVGPQSGVQNLRQIYKQQSSDGIPTSPHTSHDKLDNEIENPLAAVNKNDQDIKIPEPDYEDNSYMHQVPPPIPPKHYEAGESLSRESHSSGSGKDVDNPDYHRSKSYHANTTIPDAMKSYHANTTIPDAMKRSISTTTVTVNTNSSPVYEGYVRRTSQKHLPRGVPTTVHIEGPNTSLVNPHLMPRVSIVPQTHVSSHPPYVAVARVGDAYDDRYNNAAARHLHRGNSEQARRKLQSMYL